MTDPLRIAESAPLSAMPEEFSAIHLTLLSSLDPDRLDAALTSSLLKMFRADACVLLGDEAASDVHRQLVREAQTRGEAIRVDVPVAAMCVPLIGRSRAPATLIVERKAPFTREELRQLAALAAPMALALRNARLFAKATTDDLTALPNRQRFVVELEVAVSAEGPLSLILVDVDHFKDKSDVYGRPVGDRALAEMGDLLRSLPVLAAARSGDDEFALLLKVAGAPAHDFAEDLRKTINDRIFDEAEEGIHLTISAGVAEHRGGEMASGLFARAADALAAAKRGGRNRVEVAR
jgi:diguanylate cyclase (GGDEF)-like protein